MLASRHARGLLAGMGVTGSLLAAVAAGFALTGGVLGFNSWPTAGRTAPARALRVVAPAPQTAPAAPLALPTVLRAVPAPVVAPLLTTPNAARPAPGTAPVERRRSTTRVPAAATTPAPAATGTAPGPPANPAPAAPSQGPLATPVVSTTQDAGRAVRSTSGTAAQAAAPVPPAA